MAVKALTVGSIMTFKIKSGVDENGKDIIKKQRFGRLSLDAKDEDVFEISQAIKQISEYPIIDTSKELICSIISE